MAYKKTRKNSLSALVVVISITTVAVWQFYAFVTFKNTNGLLEVQGGIAHLWWALGLGLLACTAAFLFFLVFLRYDKNDETHITSPPSRQRLV